MILLKNKGWSLTSLTCPNYTKNALASIRYVKISATSTLIRILHEIFSHASHQPPPPPTRKVKVENLNYTNLKTAIELIFRVRFFFIPKAFQSISIKFAPKPISLGSQRCQDPKRNYFHRLEISRLRDLLVATAEPQVISKSVETSGKPAAIQTSTINSWEWNLC